MYTILCDAINGKRLCLGGISDQASAENPIAFTSGAHRSESALSMEASSAGVDDCASRPKVARPSANSLDAIASRQATFIFCTTSAGVFATVYRPNHSLKAKSFKPCSV